MANSANKPTSSAAVADLLPDPTEQRVESASGDADDLIASIADQQIDQLINESDATKPADEPSKTAAEVALTATQELKEMAQTLSNEARADLVADLNGAATEAMLTPIPPAEKAPDATAPEALPIAETPTVPPAETPHAVSETASAPAAVTTQEQPAEVSAPAAEPVAPAAVAHEPAPVVAETSSASTETTTATADTASAAPAEPAPKSDALPTNGPAMVLAPADTEINQAEIDALIAGNGPVAAPSAKPDASHANPESSADAVAKELADEMANVRNIIRPPAGSASASPARQAVASAVMTVLQWINLPVRGLSDNAREVLGIIAIVTLVNAMSLLLYLMLFR